MRHAAPGEVIIFELSLYTCCFTCSMSAYFSLIQEYTTMTTNEKLDHARCLVNAARHYLNSAYADFSGAKLAISPKQKAIYTIIGHIDNAQADLQRLAS